MKKRIFSTELAYIPGVVLVALGAAMLDKANFGMSMIVAPAYVLYRKLSLTWSFFTFGMAEYCVQALLIAALALVMRRFRWSYLLSFATAVIYGLVLDGFMALLRPLTAALMWQRLGLYAVGLLLCAAGVSMMFHTYLSPEAYELFVKEISGGFGLDINRFKTIYDCVSCLVGLLIGKFSALFDRLWEFKDALPWREFFTGEKK